MNLNDYYKDLQHATSLKKIYDETFKKAKIRLATKVNKTRCKKLEKYLTDIIYGSKNNKYANVRKQLYEKLKEAYEQKYAGKLSEDFSLGKSSDNIHIEDLPSIARQTYEAFEHKMYIYKSTIEQRLKNLDQYLNEIEEANNNGMFDSIERKYEDILKESEELRKSLEELLLITTDLPQKIEFSENDGIKEKVDHMDKLYRGLATSRGAIPPQGYGDLLEWILQAISNEAEILGEYAVNDITQDFTTSLEKMMNTAGSTTTGKDGLSISVSMKEAGQLSNVTKESITKNNKKEIFYTVSNPNNPESKITFKYTAGFSPDKERQGKMDVEFILPDPKEGNKKYRISAKNWATLKNRDFGSTNLIYTLLRNLGEEATDLYGYVISDEKSNSQKLLYADKVAKLSIVLDILMGYSQESNFADTIVINDRSDEKRPIKVYSILDIIKQVDKNIEALQLDGYNSDLIHNEMSILRNALLVALSQGRSEAVRSLFYKYLQSIKVTLTYANLSHIKAV